MTVERPIKRIPTSDPEATTGLLPNTLVGRSQPTQSAYIGLARGRCAPPCRRQQGRGGLRAVGPVRASAEIDCRTDRGNRTRSGPPARGRWAAGGDPRYWGLETLPGCMIGDDQEAKMTLREALLDLVARVGARDGAAVLCERDRRPPVAGRGRLCPQGAPAPGPGAARQDRGLSRLRSRLRHAGVDDPRGAARRSALHRL